MKKIQSADMVLFYEKLNDIREKFNLSKIVPDNSYQVKTKVYASQMNTLIDNIDSSVTEGQLKYLNNEGIEKVSIGTLIRQNQYDVINDNLNYMETLCANYAFKTNITSTDSYTSGNKTNSTNSYSGSDSICSKSTNSTTNSNYATNIYGTCKTNATNGVNTTNTTTTDRHCIVGSYSNNSTNYNNYTDSRCGTNSTSTDSVSYSDSYYSGNSTCTTYSVDGLDTVCSTYDTFSKRVD